LTIYRIKVNEYECLLCGYKWINRVNGKDGAIPERCAKCKRYGWNGEENRDPITPEESGLRRRIKGLPKLYYFHNWHWYDPREKNEKKPSVEDPFHVELVELIAKFLTLDDPRPTIAELRRVLDPPGLVIGLTSQNLHRWRGYVPDPQKPGWMKYDKKQYMKYVESDAQKQLEAMRQIIEAHPRASEYMSLGISSSETKAVELKP
jgi:hypothetical protein